MIKKRHLSFVLACYLVVAAFLQATNIRVEWSQELPEDFSSFVEDSYRSMKTDYQELYIDYHKFFKDFMTEIRDALNNQNNMVALAFKDDQPAGFAFF